MFDVPDTGFCDPWDYVTRDEYLKHPQVANFSPEISWMWEGTDKELYYAANNNTDLMFTDRKIDEQDSDFADMIELYAEIRNHLNKKDRKNKKKSKGSLNSSKSDLSSLFSDGEE